MSGWWLTLDQGGHGSRALAFSTRGRLLAEATRPVATRAPGPGRYEQDPDELVSSLEGCAGEVLDALPAGDCLGAGLATQRSSLCCWDRETGAALTPVISWRDTRNARWLEGLGLDPGRVRALTGLRPSPHYGAAKLRWCLEHVPAVARTLATGRLAWGPVASFLAYRLTRERTLAADPVNASRTLLWEPARRDWSPALLEAFGLPAEPLPPSLPSDRLLGHLDRGIPLVHCTGDQAAAVHGTGPLRAGEARINAGTGAFVLVAADWPNGAEDLLTSVVGGEAAGLSFALEGTVNGAGAALEAEAAGLGLEDGAWRPLLDANARPGVFVNGHSGLGSPWWVPRLASRYQGPAAPAARMQAVLESVVFMLAANLEAARRWTAPLDHILAGGGLSASDAFCRRLAAVTGLPVLRPASPETTARGLAWLMGGRGEHWEAPTPGRFEPARIEGLDTRHRRWREAMEEALAPD